MSLIIEISAQESFSQILWIKYLHNAYELKIIQIPENNTAPYTTTFLRNTHRHTHTEKHLESGLFTWLYNVHSVGYSLSQYKTGNLKCINTRLFIYGNINHILVWHKVKLRHVRLRKKTDQIFLSKRSTW